MIEIAAVVAGDHAINTVGQSAKNTNCRFRLFSQLLWWWVLEMIKLICLIFILYLVARPVIAFGLRTDCMTLQIAGQLEMS